MAKTEKAVQQEIRLAVGGRADVSIFRQNVGKLWAASRTKRIPGTRDVILFDARRVNAGLCPGSSDLIGWQSITITPEMVGQKIAVFTAIEVKGPRGRATKPQQNFVDVVIRAGGTGVIARSADEALEGLK